MKEIILNKSKILDWKLKNYPDAEMYIIIWLNKEEKDLIEIMLKRWIDSMIDWTDSIEFITKY